MGRYQLAADDILMIHLDSGQLLIDDTPVFPMSQTKFFLKENDAQLSFNVNADGDVESATLLVAVGCLPAGGSEEHPTESVARVVESQSPREAEPPVVDDDPPVTGIVTAADQGLPPEAARAGRAL